tara:strand:+ start:13448 stop:14473 length:1026 start_codon:yes stop_codon:yes gene_type:complete
MKYAQVLQVYLNDDDTNLSPYSIQAIVRGGASPEKIVAIPLNLNSKKIPAVGEFVCIQSAPSADMSGIKTSAVRNYYTDIVSLQSNINANVVEGGYNTTATNAGTDYDMVSAGVPSSTTPSTNSNKKNKEFEEVSNLSQLQPYSGDIIHEGRFGQSIRFGYTPQKADAKIQPSWDSSSPESPITIIRNGAGESNGYNKFVIEDINKDNSSIWLGSKQKIGLKSSNKFTLGATPTGTYNKPQIILNSDRIVLNSKTDSVLISGAKAVNVSTPNWKADMDVIFSQLEELKNQVLAINNALIPLGAGLTGIPITTPLGAPLTQATSQVATKLIQITTQLQLMKQ